MARIQQTKNTVIKTWKVSWQGEDMSRSKAIEDYDDALKFKALVEEAGELMPAISVLAENGLTRYADWRHLGVLVEMRKFLSLPISSDEAVATVRAALDLLLDVPR